MPVFALLVALAGHGPGVGGGRVTAHMSVHSCALRLRFCFCFFCLKFDIDLRPPKNSRWPRKKMYDGRAETKQKIQDGHAKKCTMVEQKLNKNMQDGHAKKCEMVEQKLNEKCKMATQKNVRWSSRN
jgi:hypothetical protein